MIVSGLVLLSALLTLTNLANGALWQDEAQTALIARTIQAHGVPLGSDGVNFFSQELGSEYGPRYVWRWHTWLPFYLVALCFALFGASTLSARLPFALFGVGTVVVSYLLGRDVLKSRRGGALCGLLLATSVPFLVLSRQSRYYSVAAFFSMLGLYAYAKLSAGGGRRFGVLFVAALVLLFHTHYVYYAALCLSALCDALLMKRSVLRRVAILCALSFALNLPWIAWIATMPYAERYAVFSLSRALSLALSFARQIEHHVVRWPLLLVPLALLLVRWRRPKAEPVWKRALPSVLYLGSSVALLCASAPAPFFRYLAPVLPVCALLLAWIVEAAMLRHWAAGLVLLAALLYLEPLRDYAYELTHAFEGPVDGIVRYLKEHAKRGDVVAITYEDLPLKFYTELRVVGGLTGEDLAPARDAQWVIVRKHVVCEKDLAVRQYLIRNLPRDAYEAIRIDAPDTTFQNRESPDEHLFRSVRDEDRVVIFRRKAP